MTDQVKIKSALISVYAKEGIAEIAHKLISSGIQIFSTGGTYDFLIKNGIPATSVESVTAYPAILGGRVKTLHPKIFGGILWRRELLTDINDVEKYEIPSIDLIIADLYPFEKTASSTDIEQEILEKIDIGGISLIRAAAKNFTHVVVIPSADFYFELKQILGDNNGITNISLRRHLATCAFNISSHYDTAIFNYFNRNEKIHAFKQSILEWYPLRYGENPHQSGMFYGDLKQVFQQLNGKELSYNNLVDVDAAINLMNEFPDPTVAIIKHTNPCGVASRSTLKEAYVDALACDPVSAFGGIIIANRPVLKEAANELNKLFFEIVIAEEYENDALELLKSKKNRIILRRNSMRFPEWQFKTILNGVLAQEKDLHSEQAIDFQHVTTNKPIPSEIEELIFANKIVKHLKSNTITLVKNRQLIGCGMGQTSRVDALRQAIVKARAFGFDTEGAIMASDAFFPFADCVEIAHEAGISVVLQPGGSIRDSDSVKFCNEHQMSMVFTGIRHFKH
ncbi:MAG: bifunctional phosphoribosylaminoimidazolecarboxamide formyltransferase/IMP cyclohydrolase [Bacteroidales bacterium]|nr:bifunctional phosphoribosylaminoimidazolecarboxamide formyltransferase/IMP cyclohydrolase [Bacteroidales bacterium]